MTQLLRLNDILHQVEAYHPGADLDLIQRCYAFAAKAHDGQLRRSGDPYVVHPLSVAPAGVVIVSVIGSTLLVTRWSVASCT